MTPATISTYRPLPGPIRDLLTDGPAERTREATRGAVRRVTIAAIRHGWSFADFDHALGDPRHALARWYLERDQGAARRSPRSAAHRRLLEWRRAITWSERNPPIASQAEARQQVGEWLAAVSSTSWRGRTGLRDRTVYVALLRRAGRGGTLTPAVSVRTLCEDTPYRTASTIVRALHSLEGRGLVTRQPQARGLPQVYRLRQPATPVHERRSSNPPQGAVEMCSSVHSPSVALGLTHGPHAAAVHAALSPTQPARADDVAALAGVSRRTAFYKLKALAADGLAIATPDGWIATEAKADDVAAQYGAQEIEMNRIFRHAFERAAWRDHLRSRHPGVLESPSSGGTSRHAVGTPDTGG